MFSPRNGVDVAPFLHFVAYCSGHFLLFFLVQAIAESYSREKWDYPSQFCEDGVELRPLVRDTTNCADTALDRGAAAHNRRACLRRPKTDAFTRRLSERIHARERQRNIKTVENTRKIMS